MTNSLGFFTQYPGNAIPGAGFTSGNNFVDDELLFSTHNYIQKGVTLEPGNGVLPLGTILARRTDTKRYVAYNSGGSNGTNVALGILRNTVDTGTDSSANAQIWQANILYSGLLKYSAVSAANSGVSLTSVLNATVNTTAGFFKF
jgi:hypothetical protein